MVLIEVYTMYSDLTLCFQDETPLCLAVKVSFKVRQRNSNEKKDAIICVFRLGFRWAI